MTCSQVFVHLDGVHRRSEDGVVVLDAPPVSRPRRTRQVTAVLLQDTQGLDQSAQRLHNLRVAETFGSLKEDN